MAENTSIEWCDSSWNPWIGCTKVGPGCDNCYAEADFDLRKHRAKWGPGNPRSRTSPANWKKPLQWNAQPFSECMKCGWRGELRDAEIVKNPPGFHPPVDSASLCPGCHHPMLKAARRRVFCASLADVFDNEVPRQWRADLFALIADTPHLDWLLLTKRIGNASALIERAMNDLNEIDPERLWIWGNAPWPNVWLGATVVNQAEADRDIPKLLAVPAALRWLSMEPLLGRIDLCETFGMWWNQTMGCFETSSSSGFNRNPNNQAKTALDWVVVGGESGPRARPMHPDWARGLRDQCKAAGVPFLFKQWGEFATAYQSGRDDNYLYDNASTGGWVDLDGTYSLGENAAPRSPMSAEHVFRIGKKAAGRLLDGKLHHEFPVRQAFFGVDPAAPNADRTVYLIPEFLRRTA